MGGARARHHAVLQQGGASTCQDVGRCGRGAVDMKKPAQGGLLARPSRLNLGQGLLQICLQVIDVFNAHRQAHHAFRDASLGQLGGIQLAVGG